VAELAGIDSSARVSSESWTATSGCVTWAKDEAAIETRNATMQNALRNIGLNGREFGEIKEATGWGRIAMTNLLISGLFLKTTAEE
jgi:hypothetical protein